MLEIFIKNLKNIIKAILLFFIILLILSMHVFGGYLERISNIKLYFSKARPILKIESLQNVINKEISQNTPIQEFYFTIKNYEEVNLEKNISEIPFFVEINLENSNSNFPIKYKIYDCEKNEEVREKIFIEKNVEFSKKYKVVATWQNQAKNYEYNQTEIIFNIEQAI